MSSTYTWLSGPWLTVHTIQLQACIKYYFLWKMSSILQKKNTLETCLHKPNLTAVSDMAGVCWNCSHFTMVTTGQLEIFMRPWSQAQQKDLQSSTHAWYWFWPWSLQWRHNGCDSVSNTSLTIVYSTVYSDADQRKHHSSASLAFVWGICWGPANSPHKWPVTRKMFPFDEVIIISTVLIESLR